MLKRILIAVVLIGAYASSHAQELFAHVTINATQIGTQVDKKVFPRCRPHSPLFSTTASGHRTPISQMKE